MADEKPQLPQRKPTLGWVVYYLAHDGVVVTSVIATGEPSAHRAATARGKVPTASWVVPVYVLGDDPSAWVPVEEVQPAGDEDERAHAAFRSRKLISQVRGALGR